MHWTIQEHKALLTSIVRSMDGGNGAQFSIVLRDFNESVQPKPNALLGGVERLVRTDGAILTMFNRYKSAVSGELTPKEMKLNINMFKEMRAMASEFFNITPGTNFKIKSKYAVKQDIARAEAKAERVGASHIDWPIRNTVADPYAKFAEVRLNGFSQLCECRDFLAQFGLKACGSNRMYGDKDDSPFHFFVASESYEAEYGKFASRVAAPSRFGTPKFSDFRAAIYSHAGITFEKRLGAYVPYGVGCDFSDKDVHAKVKMLEFLNNLWRSFNGANNG